MQAMVADIRAASSGGYAVLDELPCSNFSGLTNTSGSSSFIASVQYQDQNSQGAFANVSCTQGKGPAAAGSGSFLARAVITSCSPATACPTSPTAAITQKGTWRRVVSTYDFNTSYANIPGGPIYSYSGKECFVATYNNGSSPSGGVTLEVTTACTSTNPLEQFQYTPNWDLAIQLGGVQYCVQDPEDGSPASALPIAITTSCTATGVPQWGINDVGDIEGVAAGGSGQPNGYCLDNPLSSDPSGTRPRMPQLAAVTRDSTTYPLGRVPRTLGRELRNRRAANYSVSQISSSTSRNLAIVWTSPTRTPAGHS